MSAGERSKLFRWDLKACINQPADEPPAGLYRVHESNMADVMRAFASAIGQLAAEQGLAPDILFFDVHGDRKVLIDEGWHIWGHIGDNDLWEESRGVGPHAGKVAYGMGLTRLGGEVVEFLVPPPMPGHPIQIESKLHGLRTGDDWPLGSIDHMRAGHAGITIPRLYHGFVRFASHVGFEP